MNGKLKPDSFIDRWIRKLIPPIKSNEPEDHEQLVQILKPSKV